MNADELVRNGADALTVWKAVERLARKIAGKFPVGDREDLMQEFYIVTDKARGSWDGTMPFANYAAQLMTFRSRSYYSETSQTTTRGHFLARKYSNLRAELGEDREAIKRAAGWSEKVLKNAERAYIAETMTSIYDASNDDGDLLVCDTLPDPEAESAYLDIEREEDRKALEKALAKSIESFTDHSRRVLIDRYGLFGRECLGTTRTAKKYGVSYQAVAYMIKGIHKKLMTSEYADTFTEYFNNYLAGHNLYNGTGITRFLRSGASSVEMAILMAEKLQQL